MAEETIVDQINEDSKNFWTRLDAKQKMIFSASGIGLALAITVLMFFVFKPHYQVLYTELNQSDAAAISSYLDKQGLKYQVLDNGQTIAVANASIPKTRLALASKGIPKGSGVGFEIFDKPNITVTDFGQKLNYNRALEGELSRTISSLESVKSAKVHLAIAKKSIFKKENDESTASVIIIPSPGYELTIEQVKGIRHLVSSAVNGLESGNVQIVDSSGLSLVDLDDPESMLAKQIQKNKETHSDLEKDLEKNLLDLLRPIVGQGNVLVNVTADMNFDESEMNIELYSPKVGEETSDPVVRSEQISRETYKKGKKQSTGVPGTQNNIPTFAGSQSGDASKSKDYIKEDIVKNYEVSRTVERVKKASGQINKISVAVVINKDLTPTERATLRKTVLVAAGLDLERGDQVVITGIRFSSNPGLKEETQKNEQAMQNMLNMSLLKKFGAFCFAGLIALILLGMVMSSMGKPLSISTGRKLDDILDEEELPLLETINKKLMEKAGNEAAEEQETDLGMLKKQLSGAVNQNPENVAKALRAFIDE